MQIRAVAFKPKRRRAPITGILYHEDGRPTKLLRFEYRQNKKSKWVECPIVMQEDLIDE